MKTGLPPSRESTARRAVLAMWPALTVRAPLCARQLRCCSPRLRCTISSSVWRAACPALQHKKGVWVSKEPLEEDEWYFLARMIEHVSTPNCPAAA